VPSSAAAIAPIPVPRAIGDVEAELLDAPTPTPVTRQPLRVVVGDNVPLDLPPPVLEDEPEPHLADDDDDVPVRQATPVTPVFATPSISPDRAGAVGAPGKDE